MVIAGLLEDRRLKRLARRIVFLERPDLLAEDERTSMSDELARRRMGQSAVPGPWLTVPKALEDLDSLSERVGSDFASLRGYYSSLTALT